MTAVGPALVTGGVRAVLRAASLSCASLLAACSAPRPAPDAPPVAPPPVAPAPPPVLAPASAAPSPGSAEPAEPRAPLPVASASVAPVAPPPKRADRAWVGCQDGKPAPARYRSVREVDWCNHTYIAGIATLRRGRAELHEYEEMGGPHDTDIFRLGSVAFGDVDGDGVEDAVVVLDHQAHGAHGGSHQGARVYLFTIRAGTVARLADGTARMGSVARIAAGRILLDYAPAELVCTQELRRAGSKLASRTDPCVDIK